MPAFETGLPAARVHSNLQSSLAEIRRAEKSAVLWFAEISTRKLYLELGFASIRQYASEALGFSQNKTGRYLRLASELERLPILRASVASGEVGWTKAREVVKVASSENEVQWVEVAKNSSRRDLEKKVVLAKRQAAIRRKTDPAQVELAIEDSAPGHGSMTENSASGHGPMIGDSASGHGSMINDSALRHGSAIVPAIGSATVPATVPMADAPVAVTFRLTPLQLARYESLIEKIYKTGSVPRNTTREEVLLAALDELASAAKSESESLPRGRIASGSKVVVHKCETCASATVQTNRGEKQISGPELAAIECDTIVEREGKRNSATIRPSVRQAVLTRDRHRCQSPGCGNTRFLEVHHRIPRAAGGSNHPANLVTLCARCHAFAHAREMAGCG